jgi:hypothetical protein
MRMLPPLAAAAALLLMASRAGAADASLATLRDSAPAGAADAPVGVVNAVLVQTQGAVAESNTYSILHCLPQTLQEFKKLLDETRGYREQAAGIELDDAGLRFTESSARGAELCQVVTMDMSRTVAMAHTHSKAPDAVQEPVGADCDQPMPDYVITRAAIYVTIAKERGALGYKDSGRDGDLGQYRRVLGSEWQTLASLPRAAWDAPETREWTRLCGEEAARTLRDRSTWRRCSPDFGREAEYRQAGKDRAAGRPVSNRAAACRAGVTSA